MIKEACVESFEKALEAQNNGANRIELCENLAVGGTTPSYGTVKVCLEKLDIPIFPMIRARGGSFVYSKDEIEISSMRGGIPAITVVSIMLTGITGNVTAPLISKIFRVKHSVAVGIGIGVSSHAVGTSKAMDIGEIEGSMSALSIVFAGLLTLVWAPLLKFLV